MIQPNRLVASGIGVVMAGEALAGCSSTDVTPPPPAEYCLTNQYGNGQIYQGDHGVNDADQATWKSGVELIVTEPSDATHVRAGWYLAKEVGQETQELHFSQWMPTRNEQRLVMKIGRQSILLYAQFRALKGADACSDELTVNYSEKLSLREIATNARQQDIGLEWPKF